MSEKDRMINGLLYNGEDESLVEDRSNCAKLLKQYSLTYPNQKEKRKKILEELFGSVGINPNVQCPFYCDYGKNIHVGNNFYANYDCVFLDVCRIDIGDNCLLGPKVCIYTAAHPIDANVRSYSLEYGKPIKIGDDVWIGGNVVINPGVTIGNNVVIGSGSVVTHDIPSDSVAAGNPCKVIRNINQQDHDYWNNLAKEYFDNFHYVDDDEK